MTSPSIEHLPNTLPTGTVTFLFTDIQGSTPLWEQHPEAMKAAVALHHAALQRAITEHHGQVFKVVGDAFQAAFALPTHGLTAAIALQHALGTVAWPVAIGPLQVRVGLHVGPAEVEQTASGIDYAVSHTLNRVARIMSAGHGGQILLSREAADLLERDVPAGVTLRDLGEHHLKGLARPERLTQACAPGLQSTFPPLSSGPKAQNNLPASLTSFVGREPELRALQQRLTDEQTRLITLTGPGGTGKTRLALQAASGVFEHFPDGVWMVELAPLADPALIPQTLATALGVNEPGGRGFTRALIDHVGTKRMLLIFDNCEHLVEAAAGLASQLLQSCPRLHILATSREILGAMGETPFRVPSLGLPVGADLPIRDLAQYEAIRLFVERTRTARPGFVLNEANATQVSRICQRLDGIPLAIELAAARARVLQIDEIAARLDDTFRLLTGGSRTVLSRHQTLRASIDWSFNLLSAEERALFLRLSVFAGGFTLAAAEAVCADAGTLHRGTILDLLGQLVDKSLVIPFEAAPESGGPSESETRYRVLETIRQYARERLHDLGDGGIVRDRHLDFFTHLAEAAEPHLRSTDQVVWLDRLEADLDNLRLALEWSLAAGSDHGLRLAAALFWFWQIRGHRKEGVDWMTQLLAVVPGQADDAQPESALLRGKALVTAGVLAKFRSQFDQSRQFLNDAEGWLGRAGPAGRLWLGVGLLYLSDLERDFARQHAKLDVALVHLRAAGDPLYLAEHTMTRGTVFMEQKCYVEAAQAYHESLARREAIQDIDGIGTVLLQLGDLAILQNEYRESDRHYTRSLEHYRAVRNRVMESILLSRLGQLAMLTGDMAQAAARFSDGIALSQRTGSRFGRISSLFDLARLDLNTGEPRRASLRFVEVTRLSTEIGWHETTLIGLIFQGLAALEMQDRELAAAETQRAIAFWRTLSPTDFSLEYTAQCLENLAVLLAEQRPALAARLFAAVDRAGLTDHALNTPHELAVYADARAQVASHAPPESVTGELSLLDALSLALAVS